MIDAKGIRDLNNAMWRNGVQFGIVITVSFFAVMLIILLAIAGCTAPQPEARIEAKPTDRFNPASEPKASVPSPQASMSVTLEKLGPSVRPAPPMN